MILLVSANYASWEVSTILSEEVVRLLAFVVVVTPSVVLEAGVPPVYK